MDRLSSYEPSPSCHGVDLYHYERVSDGGASCHLPPCMIMEKNMSCTSEDNIVVQVVVELETVMFNFSV